MDVQTFKAKNYGKNRIKLDLDYVFYLLGECANESIGVNLKGVEVRERFDNSTTNETQTHTDGHFEYDERWVDGDGQTIPIESSTVNLAGGVYHNTQESLQEEGWAKKNSVGVGVAAGWKKPAPSEVDNQYVEDEEDNQYTEDDNQVTE